MAKPKRHDVVALERQRDLAAVLIIANLAIGGVCAWIIDHYDWDLGTTPTEQALCIGAFAVSLTGLLIASGLFEWLPRLVPSLRREGGGNSHGPSRIGAYIAARRMYPYYVGLWANLIAIALLTEVTGGLAESPFLALFVALVLIGQQVSRFRLQTGVLLITAVVIVVAMLAFESAVTSPPEPHPEQLVIAAVLLSFAAGGLLNYYEKSHNHLIPKWVKPPTHARIYKDGRGIWRFSIYGQDPVLLGPADPPVAAHGFPGELRERFERQIEEMGAFAEWNDIRPCWPAACDDSFVVPLMQGGEAPTAAFRSLTPPIAFAHRGGSVADENSLAAFAAAAELGYRVMETDVRTTKDGVPLVFHDADLARMTGHVGRVGDMLAAEISRLSLPQGAKIPTLAEALRTFPQLYFNIDLKDEASIESVSQVLVEHDALERVCVTSFSERRVLAARRLLGARTCTGLGVTGMFRVGLTSMFPGGGWTRGASALQIPYRRYGIRLATPTLVKLAHRAGLAVHVWTLNEREEIEAALDAGVDGVITDQLPLLKQVLETRSLWQGS